jgi:hypothetical protein
VGFAAVLLFVAIKLDGAADRAAVEHQQYLKQIPEPGPNASYRIRARYEREHTSSGRQPYALFSWVLGGAAAIVCGYAVLPNRVMEKLLGPPPQSIHTPISRPPRD